MSTNETENCCQADEGISCFERYLSLWVGVCILAGLALGQFFPEIPNTLEKFSLYQVNLPVAVLIWLMIYPMMVEVDFYSIVNVGKQPKGLVVTLVANWLIKPFTMFFFAWLFLQYFFKPFIPADIAQGYVAGAILLGAAPCTAMVFVWSYLTDGDAGYTLVQVSINDLILLFAYAPLVTFLLGIGGIDVPWMTVLLSVVLFIVIPLFFGYLSRVILINKKGEEWFEDWFLPALDELTMIGLLLTLILLFSFQGEFIMESPLHILFIAIPLTIQTLFIFTIAYGWSYLWNIRHPVAAPASMIGASNFFELAVATAITLFGMGSPAALATVVGVLIEVPLMLSLVWFANKTRNYF
ncbi:MAG: ACR3 family arsenite efflux transporter [bacterium]